MGAKSVATTGYAGFWVRAVASILDYLVISIFVTALAIPTSLVAPGFAASITARGGGDGGPADSGPSINLVGTLVTNAAQFLYRALMTASPTQATLGKLAMNLKVTDREGRRLTLGRAAGRELARFLSVLTLGIGYMMAGWTARKQALHDKLAGTFVFHAG